MQNPKHILLVLYRNPQNYILQFIPYCKCIEFLPYLNTKFVRKEVGNQEINDSQIKELKEIKKISHCAVKRYLGQIELNQKPGDTRLIQFLKSQCHSKNESIMKAKFTLVI